MDLAAWTPRALSVLRIVTGLLFLEHGTGKLLGFPPSDQAAATLFSLIGVQGVLELVGGFLILIGLFTRPVAFILAGDMAVAYFMAHAPKSFFPTINGGQLAILFCFVFLILGVCRWWDVECGRKVGALAHTLSPGPKNVVPRSSYPLVD
jgi:putative oxidoreductase